jgi:hypothetical protein
MHRVFPALLAAACFAACAAPRLTDQQIADLSDVDACAAAGRAYARNDIDGFARISSDLDRRAAREDWMGSERCITFAEMAQRDLQASAARKAAMGAAMRQVGQQLQQNAAAAQGNTVHCTSRTAGTTTTTDCH